MTNNKTILAWIDEMKALVNPDQVVWIDGSEEQLEELRKEAVESGEMIKLNQEKLPGCYYHRTAPNDVARVEDRTLICSRKKRTQADQPLERAAGSIQDAVRYCSWQLQGPYHVRYPVLHGPGRFPAR